MEEIFTILVEEKQNESETNQFAEMLKKKYHHLNAKCDKMS